MSTAALPRFGTTRPAATAAGGAWFLRCFRTLTFAYPLLWLVGFAGLYWVALGLAGAGYLVQQRKTARLTVPLVVLLLLLLASLPVGVVSFGFDFARVASLFGNLLVWIGLIALITLASSHDVLPAATRGMMIVGVSQGLLTAVAQAMWPRIPPLPLLSGVASHLPTGLAAFAATGGLYDLDWLGQAAFRSSGIMAQPTWAGATGAIAAIVGARALFAERGAWRLLGGASILAGLYSLDLSLSRSTEISLCVAALAGIVVAVRRYSSVLSGVLAMIGALLIGIVLLVASPQIIALLQDVNDAREGSLDSRGAIYAKTFSLVQQLPVPLLGYGIKPKEQGLVASVATHSSYLGLLFRGGALALAALLIFFIAVLVLAVRAANGWAVVLATLITMWCTLEDFDPGHLVPLGIVIAVALLRRRGGAPPTRAQARADRAALASR